MIQRKRGDFEPKIDTRDPEDIYSEVLYLSQTDPELDRLEMAGVAYSFQQELELRQTFPELF